MRHVFDILRGFRDSILRRAGSSISPSVRTADTQPDLGAFAAAGDVNTLTWYDDDQGENRHTFMVDYDAVEDREAPLG